MLWSNVYHERHRGHIISSNIELDSIYSVIYRHEYRKWLLSREEAYGDRLDNHLCSYIIDYYYLNKIIYQHQPYYLWDHRN